VENQSSKQKPKNKGLRLFSKIVCVSVVLLIFKGALVTSNDAGLSVPDWPTSFGDNMFLFPPSKWVGIIFFEHVHRLLASIVGFLTLVLTVWIFWVDKRRWVKVLALSALLAVILQGVLGGLTVLFLLPTAISSAHAILAQTFFVITILIAYSQSLELDERKLFQSSEDDKKLFKRTVSFAVLVYIQLILGAVMRHSFAGLAVPDFPTMGGEWLPSFDSAMLDRINAQRSALHLQSVTYFQVIIHLLHRLFAFFILIEGIHLFSKLIKKGALKKVEGMGKFFRTRKISILIASVIVLQVILGISTVLTLRNPWIASLHVVTGAVLLGSSVLLAIRLFPMEKG